MQRARSIVGNALRVSIVVGTVLNTINQGSEMARGGAVSWVHILLNYLVPYCVATYSGAKALMTRSSQ